MKISTGTDSSKVILTEPIGSIPRPFRLIYAVTSGSGDDVRLVPLCDQAIRTEGRKVLCVSTGRGKTEDVFLRSFGT